MMRPLGERSWVATPEPRSRAWVDGRRDPESLPTWQQLAGGKGIAAMAPAPEPVLPGSSTSAGSLPGPAARAEAGQPHRGRATPAHARPARAQTPPAVRRCPGGARHRRPLGIAPPGRQRSQGRAYSPQARQQSAPREEGEAEAPWGPPRLREEAPERRLRPRAAGFSASLALHPCSGRAHPMEAAASVERNSAQLGL